MQRIATLLLAVAAPVFFAAAAAHADGDVAAGRKTAIRYCARCHVIADYNPYGGIESTPSFQMLARRADMADLMRTFYARRPHPAFVVVPDVPKWSKAPPYATPFTVQPEDIENLVSYVETLKSWKRPPRRRRR